MMVADSDVLIDFLEAGRRPRIGSPWSSTAVRSGPR
jgi:hypothetical protein